MSNGAMDRATASDEALYRRVLAGDVGALEDLVPRYHGPLLGFLYRLTGDRHLAEDLLQETFTRLVTYAGTPPARFKPWAFAIARNLAHDHLRSAYHRREHTLAPAGRDDDAAMREPADTAPGADALLVREDERRAVAAALHRLPPPQREAVILRFYHDLKIEEIAEVTGVPSGTAKSRLFHGLKRLKSWLEPELQEGEVAYEPATQPGSGRRAPR